MNHEQVAKRFYNGSTKANGCNMFVEGDCLYSYGKHFILAQRIYNTNGQGNLFLLNGDRYSVSTSKHQGHTRSACGYNSPTTSFTALQNANISLDSLEILDYTPDKQNSILYKQLGWKEFRNNIPTGATVQYQRDRHTNEIIEISYHLAGSILIKHNDKHFICGMDDNSYFVSELPHGCNSVNAAYQMLKPTLIRTIETENPDMIIQRQGEWFFYPVPKQAIKQHKVKKVDFNKNVALPTTDSQSNLHTVTRLLPIMSNDKDLFYCFGTVRHSEHKIVKLGSIVHVAVCNTAVNNWSVSGVD